MDAKSYGNSSIPSDWLTVLFKRLQSKGKIDFIDPDLVILKNAGLIEVHPEFTVELSQDFLMEGEWEYQFEKKQSESIPEAWQRFRDYYYQKTGVMPPNEILEYPKVWVAKYLVRFIPPDLNAISPART